MSDINGFLLLDKDMGISSHKTLYPIKKLLGKKTKIGHTGTLDPNATGLLPIAIGRATKFIQFLGGEKKLYRAGIKFGIKTDTADIWGNLLEEREDLISIDDFSKACASFVGKIEQIPPMYSALKKDGKALYKYAREGIEVERKSRNINIYGIKIIDFEYPNAIVEVECSKGTYIRTLIEDIADSVSAIASMSSLRRLKTDGFDIINSYKIDDFNKLGDIEDRLIPILMVFEDLPKVYLDSKHEKHVRNGVPVDLNRFMDSVSEVKNGYYSVFSEEGYMFALAERNEFSFKTLLVI